jgi:hypothetical protein
MALHWEAIVMDEKEAILVLTAEAEGNARRSSVGSRDRRCWERTRAAGEVLIAALRLVPAVITGHFEAARTGEIVGIVEPLPAKASDDTYGPLHKARPEKFPTRIDEE